MSQNQLVVVQEAIDQARPQFMELARNSGSPVDFEVEQAYAIQIMKANPYLAKCPADSIRDAILNVAMVGLSLNPVLQHAYLIPRWDSKRRKVLCNMDPGYRGLIKLATDSGTVKAVQAAVVYMGEVEAGDFKMTRGTDPQIIHTVNPLLSEHDLGKIVGAYCIAEIEGASTRHMTWMAIHEIDNIAARSESFNPKDKNKKPSGPWVTDFAEMCVKTVIKRAQKQWPKGNARLEHAVHLANVAEGYVDDQPAQPEPEEAIILVSKDQADELKRLCRHAKMRVARVYERYGITKMSDLPADKFAEARTSLLVSVAHHDLKTAEQGTPVYASDYELSLEDLEQIAATYKSAAVLRTKRED